MSLKVMSLLAIISILCGCEGSAGCPHPKVSQTTPAIDLATSATVRGKVIFEGTVPPPQRLDMGGNPECKALHAETAYEARVSVKDGALKDAFVYIKSGLEKYTFKTATDAVIIDQSNCRFVPRILAIQAHQPILVRNSDPTLHNVHAMPIKSGGWNIGLTSAGSQETVYICTPEVMVPIKCDLHNWMTAFIGVVPHPYFKVTDADGAFEFKGLPPGEYTINTWHEILGIQSQKIKLEPKETKEIPPFKFRPK